MSNPESTKTLSKGDEIAYKTDSRLYMSVILAFGPVILLKVYFKVI